MTSSPPRSPRSRRWLPASLAVALAAVLAGAATAHAAGDSAAAAYRDAVAQALALVRQAEAGDAVAAGTADQLLVVDGVDSQPDIQDLLRQGGPARLREAEQGLQALTSMLQQPAATADPAAARARLHAILSQPRYQPQQPSLFDRAVSWILERLSTLLRGLGPGGGASGLILLGEVIAAAALGAFLLYLLLRSGVGRGAAEVMRRGRGPRRLKSAAEYFAEADRLAGAQAWTPALRALAGAVATRLGGPGAWERSPLTVRELYRSRRLLDELRPLLLPFESAAYGHRPVDAGTYERAAAVAAPYRAEPEALEAGSKAG